MIFVYVLLVFFIVLGFCILFHSPKRSIFPTCAIGALSYFAYLITIDHSNNAIMASFVGALVVGFTSDISARLFKEAATIFIAPAIIPFVPGTKLYYTVLYLIEENYEEAAAYGTETVFIAGAIALGLVVSGSVVNMAYVLKRKTFRKTP